MLGAFLKSHMKLVVIIAAVVVLIIGAIVFVNVSGITSSDNVAEENTTSVSPGEANTNSTLNMNEQSTTVTEITDEDDETEVEVIESEEVIEVDEEETTSNTSSSSGYTSSDAIKLASIDQDKLKTLACEFLTAFLTYDATSCASGNYVASWSGYVTSDALAGGSTLIYKHGLNSWNTAVSTYSELYSYVQGVEAKSVYVSHITSDDDEIAVRCLVVLDENQGEPGDMDWEVVQTNEMSYAVYFDANYKVTNVVRQNGRTIS